MMFFVDLTSVIVEVFCIHIFLRGVLRQEAPESRLRALVGYGIFGLLDAVCSICIGSSFVNIAFALIGIFLLARFIHKAGILASIFASLSFMAIFALLDILVMAMLVGFGFDSQLLMSDTNARILYIIIQHFLLLGIVCVVSAILGKDRGILSGKTFLFLTPCWVVSILLCCILCAEVTVLHRSFSNLYLFVALGLLYTNIVSIYLLDYVSRQEQVRHRDELAEHHYAMEKEYYQYVHEQREELRGLWHDIDKYYLAMQAMVGDNKHSEVDEQIAFIHDALQKAGSMADVNNTTVNVILNRYLRTVEENGITLELDVQVPPSLFVTAADLYILIGNTLDNAIDACLLLPESQRTITLKLRVQNDILFYSIKNNYDPSAPIPLKNRFHGYGLNNVKKCVEKYHGSVRIEKDQTAFLLEAHMNGN